MLREMALPKAAWGDVARRPKADRVLSLALCSLTLMSWGALAYAVG